MKIESENKYRALRDIPNVYTGGFYEIREDSKYFPYEKKGDIEWYKEGRTTIEKGINLYSQFAYDDERTDWRFTSTPEEWTDGNITWDFEPKEGDLEEVI